MNTQIILAGESFDLDRAQEVIAGYCFGEVESSSRPPRGDGYGEDLPNWRRRRWGYLSYDCQRGSGPPPDIVDIVAPVLLNVFQGYGVRLISDLLTIAPRVRAVVATIEDPDFCFWNLLPDQIAPRGVPQAESLALHQAWYLVESVPGADVAITHKLLHHAWPHLFPLIDNVTIEKLGRNGAWVTILEDLQRHEDEFDQLETWFDEVAASRGEVRLTRLRLYDILLWCRLVNSEELEAQEMGKRILSQGR